MGRTIVERRSRPNVAVLDAEFRVRMAHPGREQLGTAEFQDAARRIVSEGLGHLDLTVHRVRHRIRIVRLHGPDPMRYAMFVEQRGSRRPLRDAYDRFGLSAREMDVLALIVDGASNRQIAEALCIVPATVQNHVRSISAKTGAKRRGDLLARVFGVHEP